jgi:hypothetical protein
MATGQAITWNQSGQIVGTLNVEIPPENANADLLQQRARAALAANTTYLAIGTPTNAQVAAQVRRLTQECTGLIRLLLGQLDSTADTA